MAEAQASSTDLAELTVLMIGEGEPLAEGVKEALERRGLVVLTSPVVGSTQAAIAMAPDLILLVGDAAAQGGRDTLPRLAASPLAAVVPVAMLADDAKLDDRLRAFRFGAAAVVPRSASVDAIAAKVTQLVQEIPERSSRTSGELGDTTLDDFVDVLARELRAGILSVKPKGGRRDDTIRLVLGEGRTVADVVEQFVAKVRPLVQEAEVVRYEFHEKPGGTVHFLGAEDPRTASPQADIRHMRLLLADDDVTRADAVAQELRERGANVVMTDLAGTRIERARDLDPGVLIIGDDELRGTGHQLVRRMREDTRLRWAFLLVVKWDDVWSPNDPAPLVDRIVNKLYALSETERTLKARAAEGDAFDTRLEVVGPARLLRALANGKGTFHATVQNRRVTVRVDFAEGLIAGAVADVRDGDKKLYGPAALSALLSVATGKVRVEPVTSPAAANIMATVDGALSTAEAEQPPIRPSTIVKESPEGKRVAMARYTPAQPMQALGKNVPAATQKGIHLPKARTEDMTKPGIAAPAATARSVKKPAMPPRPAKMPPAPKVTLAGLTGAAPAWKPPPPRTDPTLESAAPPPPAALDTTEPTALPPATTLPDTTAPEIRKPPATTLPDTTAPEIRKPPPRRPRRHPTLVGMPSPTEKDPNTGPVQNPTLRGGPDATHDRIEPPTDVMELPPEMRSSAGASSSFPPPAARAALSSSAPADESEVSDITIDVSEPKPKDATMPLETADIEYAQITAPRASSAPPPPPRRSSVPPKTPVFAPPAETASPFGVTSPVPPQAQPTMPLTTDDIEYSQLRPLTPELERKHKASRAATWVLAAGIGGLLVVAVAVGIWLMGGDDEQPVTTVANGSNVETVEVQEPRENEAEPEDETPAGDGNEEAQENAAQDESEDESEAESEDESEDEAEPEHAAVPTADVPGRPVRAQVHLPTSRRASRMPDARREREARRYRIRGARALRRGQWPLALRMYRQALAYDPESAEAHKGYAIALYRRGRYEDAVAWMRRAIALDGSQADWYVLLGDGYREMNDHESASAAWRRAIDVDPENAAARERLD